MKTRLKTVVCSLAVAVASATFAADYPDAILADGPLAYYRFSDNLTAPAFDYATNAGTFGFAAVGAYLGVEHPASGALVGGVGNTGINITNLNNGQVARVRVPYLSALNQVGPFSVELWAKPSKTNDLGCAASSVDFGSAVRTGWILYQGNSAVNNGSGRYFRAYRTGGANTAVFVNLSIDTNHWYHVVGTFDGATTIKLYVDGQPIATNTLAGAYTPNTNTIVPLTFGTRGDGTIGYGGLMDEAVYYTNALSAADVLAHYQNGINPSPGTLYATLVQAHNPAVYFRFNEPAKDYPAAANSGSLAAAANGRYMGGVTGAPGPSGPSFPGFEGSNTSGSFDGLSGSVQVSNITALNFEGPITLAAWIKPVTSIDNGLRNIISHGWTGTPEGEVQLRRWGPYYEIGTWPVGGYTWMDMPIEDEANWVFLVATYDGTNVKLFHNGVESSSEASTSGALLVNAPWGIGSRGGDIVNDGRWFDGEVDEAAIFNKALTPGRIRSLYYAAVGSNAPPVMVSDPPVVSPAGTVFATATFSISADVAGAPPLHYQWRLQGTNLPGATATTYVKAAALSDAGNYDLVVTNLYGAVTSQVVSVFVDPAVPVSIVQDPVSRSVYPGGQASFTVVVNGTAPTFQWKHAGTNLPGATSSKLFVTNCGVAQTGTYVVGVTNIAGGLVSAPATLSLLTPVPGSYEQMVVSLKPLSYWRLDETVGTIAFDNMGGYDGIISNAVSLAVAGPSAPQYPGLGGANTCYNFDGFSGSVQVGNPAALNFIGPITLGAWIRPTAPDDGLRSVLSHGYTTTPNGEVQIRRNGNTYELGSWPTGGAVWAGVQPEDPGNWVFIVGTFDGVNWKFYHNAKVIGITTGNGPVQVNAGWGLGGRGDYAIGDERLFQGEIDEAMIFNRALTGEEICALYNRAIGYLGSVEPVARLVNGVGSSTLTNVDFSTDGGFTFLTPVPSVETDWVYTGTSWASAGQDTALGFNNVSYLTSPAYTATKSGVVKLTFTHRYSFEADPTLWDGGAVDVSINGKPFTRVPGVVFDQNGYIGPIQNAAALLGQPAFGGDSPGHPAFITSSCTVAGVQAGDTIRIRFVASYDQYFTGSLTPSGWEIDSFQLTEGGTGVSVECPCGILQHASTLNGPWVDAGNPLTVQTNAGPQRFFRVK